MLQTANATQLLLRIATTRNEQGFVVCVLRLYFQRVIHASERKLMAHGLRPIVAPVVAELALARTAAACNYSEFISLLIADDDIAADLAIRAINTYTDRFASMSADAIAQETGLRDHDTIAASISVRRNFDFINHAKGN